MYVGKETVTETLGNKASNCEDPNRGRQQSFQYESEGGCISPQLHLQPRTYRLLEERV